MALPADPVDQVDSPLAGRRVKVCQRLIKQQDIHIIYQHACHGNSLFLSAGKLRRCIAEKGFDIHNLCHFVYCAEHLFLLYAVVFQCKKQHLLQPSGR